MKRIRYTGFVKAFPDAAWAGIDCVNELEDDAEPFECFASICQEAGVQYWLVTYDREELKE